MEIIPVEKLYAEFLKSSEDNRRENLALKLDRLKNVSILSDFMHCNISFPTREIVGLHRLNILSKIALQDGLKTTLVIYDNTLPSEEAAREGGGFTFKLDGPPYSIGLLLPECPYFRQTVNRSAFIPTDEISAYYLDRIYSSKLNAAIAISTAKIDTYKFVTGADTYFDTLSISAISKNVVQMVSTSSIFHALMHSEAMADRHAGMMVSLASNKSILGKHMSISDVQKDQSLLSSENFCISMDIYLCAMFVINSYGHFGNSYGRVHSMKKALGQTSPYLQIGKDGQNSIPLPSQPLKVRGRKQKRLFSLLSTQFRQHSRESLNNLLNSYV